MGKCFQAISMYIERMNMQQWSLVFVVVIAFGVLCMRGLGSRRAG